MILTILLIYCALSFLIGAFISRCLWGPNPSWTPGVIFNFLCASAGFAVVWPVMAAVIVSDKLTKK